MKNENQMINEKQMHNENQMLNENQSQAISKKEKRKLILSNVYSVSLLLIAAVFLKEVSSLSTAALKNILLIMTGIFIKEVMKYGIIVRYNIHLLMHGNLKERTDTLSGIVDSIILSLFFAAVIGFAIEGIMN